MEKKLYKVREGFSIRLRNHPELYLAGGVVELETDIASQHHQLEPISSDHQVALELANAAAAAEAVDSGIRADILRKQSAERDLSIANELTKQAKLTVADAKYDIGVAQKAVSEIEKIN